MLDVDTIAARASRATEGPWITGDGTGGTNDGRIRESHGWNIANTHGHEANADFIACAREDIPNLVAEVRRLRGLLDDAKSLLAEFATDPDDDPCWYDHHGYCQAHGHFESNQTCRMRRVWEMLGTARRADTTTEA